MKNMMKLMAILLTLALVFSLAACGAKEELAVPQDMETMDTEEILPEGETAAPEQTPEAETAATEQTSEPETATPAPEGETTATDASATTQEVTFDETVVDAELLPEDELIYEDEIGVPPAVTVKYAVYEAMSDSEKAAYQASFSNALAFEQWEEMALANYEADLIEDDMLGLGSLNLKEIFELLTGKTVA